MDIVRRGLAASPDSKRERLTRLVNLYCNWQGKYNDTLPKALLKHNANRLSRTAHRYFRSLKDVIHATGWTRTKTLAAFHKVVDFEIFTPNDGKSGRNHGFWALVYYCNSVISDQTLGMLREGPVLGDWTWERRGAGLPRGTYSLIG